MTEPTPNTSPFDLDEGAPGPSQGSAAPNSNDKLLAGLAYVSQVILPAVLPAVLLLGEDSKRSPFIRHHAIQSLGLLVATILYEVLATIVFIIVSAVLPCLACGAWIIFLLPLVPLVYYGWLAFQGQYVDIPWLTAFLKNNKML